jgi:hypothetical protein
MPKESCCVSRVARLPLQSRPELNSSMEIGTQPCFAGDFLRRMQTRLRWPGISMPLAWRERLAIAAIGSIDERTRTEAEALGFAVAVLPDAPEQAPPPQLIDLLGASA